MFRKLYIIVPILLLFAVNSFGAMTNSLDTRPNADWWTNATGSGKAIGTLWGREVEAILEAWTIAAEEDDLLTFPTNGAVICNALNGSIDVNEASENLRLTFTSNDIAVSSTSGVTNIDFDTLILEADEMIFKPVADANTTEGTVYYDSDTDKLYVRNASTWVDLTTGSAPAGSDQQIQYNDGGSAFGAISSVIWDDTNFKIADDVNEAFGTDADWLQQFDTAASQLLLMSNANGASATTDPMIQILVDADTANGSNITADQDVFGVAKGTQASNIDLFVVDEDGDATVGNDLSVGGDLTVTGTFYQAGIASAASGDVALTIDAVGTGIITVGQSSTGNITLVRNTSITGNLTANGDVDLGSDSADSLSTNGLIITDTYWDDGTTHSPVIYLKDATDETCAIQKQDNGDTHVTIPSDTDFEIVTGNLAVGNGTPDVTLDGEDAYINGTLEVDGASRFDGDTVINNQLTINAASPTINICDSDASAGDDNITIVGAATDTGDGSEDVDLTISQQIAGTLRAVATFNADGNITLGYGTQNVVSTADIIVTGSDLSLGTAGIKLTGDGDGAITFLGLGDGADEDLTFNLDDTANTCVVSSSTALDKITLTGIAIDTDDVQVTSATPSLKLYDTDASAGDINAKVVAAATDTDNGSEDIDVTMTQQVNGSDHDFLVSDADGNLTLDSGAGTINMTDTVVFNGGQTRMVRFDPKVVELDGTNPPALTDHGTDAQCNISVLAFDADGGATGDDIAYISWKVPDGYVVDSARLIVCYTFSTAEDAADEAQFDFAVNAVATGETLDAAGTALADQTTVITDASTDNGKLHITQYNIEVEDIAVDDLVTIEIAVDESASALAASGTLDVLYFEIEYESTE